MLFCEVTFVYVLLAPVYMQLWLIIVLFLAPSEKHVEVFPMCRPVTNDKKYYLFNILFLSTNGTCVRKHTNYRNRGRKFIFN